jgi:hypothetical protein
MKKMIDRYKMKSAGYDVLKRKYKEHIIDERTWYELHDGSMVSLFTLGDETRCVGIQIAESSEELFASEDTDLFFEDEYKDIEEFVKDFEKYTEKYFD